MRLSDSFYVAFGQLPPFREYNPTYLKTIDEVHDCLKSRIPEGKIGVLLSSGRDSLILAALVPKGTKTYTARLSGRRDESALAARMSDRLGLEHTIIEMSKEDYDPDQELFQQHPLLCCPWVNKIARQAKRDGIDTLITGTGTLGGFGEQAKLVDLSRNPKKFLSLRAKQQPEKILREPYPLTKLCSQYIKGGRIDVVYFMGLGRGETPVTEMSMAVEGVRAEAPYHGIIVKFDLNRAKKEGKYLLGELYERLYDEPAPPKRVPALTDHAAWLEGWRPSHPRFRDDIDLTGMGIKLWQLYKLEHHWRLNDRRNRT